MTQEELAARAGLSVSAISLLERGARTTPRAGTVARLSAALGLDPAERQEFASAARRKRFRARAHESAADAGRTDDRRATKLRDLEAVVVSLGPDRVPRGLRARDALGARAS